MNIIDYTIKNGIYTLDEAGFNAVDGLIISQISYLKFEGMIPGPGSSDDGITFAELLQREDIDSIYRDERYREDNEALFEAVSMSRRFCNAKANSFIDIVDDELDIQFSAMT